MAQSKKDIERGRSLASGDGLIAEDELDRLDLEMARSTLLVKRKLERLPSESVE